MKKAEQSDKDRGKMFGSKQLPGFTPEPSHHGKEGDAEGCSLHLGPFGLAGLALCLSMSSMLRRLGPCRACSFL